MSSMSWAALIILIATFATAENSNAANARNARAIQLTGSSVVLVVTNNTSFELERANPRNPVREIEARDQIEFFFLNKGTNMQRLMTLRPRYAFFCRLYDAQGRSVSKVPEANNARFDPPKLISGNIGRYLQPINVNPGSGPRTVLFKTADVFEIENPGRYTLEVGLWLWSSKSNTLYKSDTLQLPIRAKSMTSVK